MPETVINEEITNTDLLPEIEKIRLRLQLGIFTKELTKLEQRVEENTKGIIGLTVHVSNLDNKIEAQGNLTNSRLASLEDKIDRVDKSIHSLQNNFYIMLITLIIGLTVNFFIR
jgi:predicted  nucleic acid-binding Zn-ribbon protein